MDWVTPQAEEFMSRGYLKSGETIKDRVRDIVSKCRMYTYDTAWCNEFYSYIVEGYYSFSSPVWANFGRSGMPISCNGTYVGDSVASILEAAKEIGHQTSKGAGTSAYVGNVRPSGSKISTGGISDGPISFCRIYDTVMDVISQGNTRRGACAVYVDIEHSDIEDFFKIRGEGHPIQHLSWGVCIGDEFMEEVDSEPRDRTKRVWLQLLKSRMETGYPYIFFRDTVNSRSPFSYPIYASNLCSEICLPSSDMFSFVCCLASMNMSKYNEWKSTRAVEILVDFLNLVLHDYVMKAKYSEGYKFERERNFIKMFGAIGIGQLGWHTYLQKSWISWSSQAAKEESETCQGFIYFKALNRSEQVWKDRDLRKKFHIEYSSEKKAMNRANATLTAIAPTTSSSFILGNVSQSIEPWISNYYVRDLQKGQYSFRNPELRTLLQQRNLDNDLVWTSILAHQGSVQHLKISKEEKEVFKTFEEIDPMDIVKAASKRQKFLDQSQSLNLIFRHDALGIEVHKVIVEAWKRKLKTLYYHKSTSPTQELAIEMEQCSVCEV